MGGRDNNRNKPHECAPNVPRDEENPFSSVRKCGAKTRRKTECQSPAMKNGRCRLHGGLSTGPKTELGRSRCGNWKHGRYSRIEKMRRALINELVSSFHK